jgi:hypothetical protein
VSGSYAGRQIVGIDLHRRRSVLVRMTEAGETLETVRISAGCVEWLEGVSPSGSRRSRREPLGSCHPALAAAVLVSASHLQWARSPGRDFLIAARVCHARRGARRRCLYLRLAHRRRYRSMWNST